MCQINIVGDVPFPVSNYTNIDQSAIKKPELVKTIIYSECNIKLKILLWQKPIQYSILHAVRFHKTVTLFFLKKTMIESCEYCTVFALFHCTIKLINLDSEINATLTLSLNLVTEHLKLSVQS